MKSRPGEKVYPNKILWGPKALALLAWAVPLATSLIGYAIDQN